VFNETARPIVDSVLQGYNGTIFAYGQTGTGKTFTMEGVIDRPELRGIMPSSFQYIFDALQNAPKEVEFLVRASFMEIYMEDLFDLLSRSGARQKMQLKTDADHSAHVKDLSCEVVKSPEDLFAMLARGQKQRKVGETAMNKGSSRSHSIFTIIVESSTTDPATGAKTYKQGKLNLVDLAGSERQKKTHAEGERLDEGKFINLSLSALGNVIRTLARGKGEHVPFRDSKLTLLLRDSLGGNTKTVMIANVGPAAANHSETMSTLRYANDAKNIKNKPTVNEDPKDAALRSAQEEISLLKARLLAKQRGIDFSALSPAQQLALGQQGTLPDGAAPAVQEREIIKIKIVDSGYRMEDLQRVIAQAREEEAAMADKTEAEKNEILARKRAAEAKFEQLDAELRRNQEALRAEEEEMERARAALAEKQQELVHGGGHVERAAAARKELIEAEGELERRRGEQDRLAQELAERDEARLLADERYADAGHAVQALQKKLKDLFVKVGQKKEDARAIEEEFQQEKEDYLQMIRELDKEIKLQSLVIESFMPYSFYRVVDRARQWDPFREEWVLPFLENSGNSTAQRGEGSSTGHIANSREEQVLQREYLAAGSVAAAESVYGSYPRS
jgi:kinesin family protein 3/17